MKTNFSRIYIIMALIAVLFVAVVLHLWRDYQVEGTARLGELLAFGVVTVAVLAIAEILIYSGGIGVLRRLRKLTTPLARPGENVQQVGQAIYLMVDQLTAQRAELELLNAELEKKVAERTQELEQRNQELQAAYSRRMEDEAALARSEELLKLALEGAQLGMWVWDHLDSAPVCTRQWPLFENDAAPDIGSGLEDWESLVHPDDLEQTRQAYLDHLEGRTEYYSVEYRIRLASGRYVWVQDQGRVLRRTPAGQPVCVAGTLQDIDKRKEIEENLRASVARFHAIFAQAGIGITLVSPNGRIMEANRAFQEMLGLDARELAGAYFLDLTHAEDRPLNQELWEGLLAGTRASYRLEKRYLRKKGGYVWCSVTVTPVRDKDGSLQYGVAMVEDISLRKKAESALASLLEMERRQRELAQMLREIGEQMNSTLEYQTVFERLLEQIPRLVPCDVIDLLQVEGDSARIIHRRWLSKDVPAVEKPSGELRVADTANLHWMSQNQRPLVIPDVRVDPGWVAHERSEFVRSWAGAPIISQGRVIAFLSLISFQPDFFNQEQAEALAAFTAQVALAFQNASLFQAVRNRAEESETLRQATSVLVSALDLERVLDEILIQLKRVVPYDSASVFLQEDARARLVVGAGLPEPERLIGQTFVLEDDQLFQEIYRRNDAVLLADAKNDPRFHGWGGVNYVGGWIGVPLRSRGQIIGALTLDSRQVDAYGEADAALAQAFADEAAVAVENARLFHQVQHMAITDPLTGLYNRRYFYEAASDEMERSRRYLHPMALVMFDIDHFKVINDTYGHPAGDQVLMEVSRRLRTTLREIDVVARYGGEEFVVLLPETGLEGALLVAERLRRNIMDVAVVVGSQPVEVSVSVGAAVLDEDCPDLETLLEFADQALYQSKSAGRGRVTAWRVGRGALKQ